jgi:ribulose-phosphate 3-epimerase
MRKGGVRIVPSVLSVDLLRLRERVGAVVAGGADWIHVDVMDGHFVPNLTFGAPVIAAIRRITDLPIDVHLMVEQPERYIDQFADAGASVFTFHPEATHHVQRQLDVVRQRGMLAGLALNPGAPLAYAAEVVSDLDLLLIMTVNPGFPAQEFIPASIGKISRARRLLADHGSSAYLEVDGGISRDTIAAVHAAGADTFVTGSAVFSADAPGTEVQELRKRCFSVV